MTPEDRLAEVVRAEGSRLVAVLARRLGDLQLAEDALQDACVSATEVWSRSTVPDDPAAWLYVAARRKALDVLRREVQRPHREQGATALADQLEPVLPARSIIEDDLLRLIFTCCHPSLDLDARVALALRTLCGLSTGEVARVLLVGESAMSKRLTRAKAKIAAAAIPFRVPDADELAVRLAGVAAVIHLVYTAGHAAGDGPEVVRADLCDEAIRLARLLADLLPEQPTALGLLALLLLTDARRPTRTDAGGDIVPLAQQDRRCWDRSAIEEGCTVLDRSLLLSEGIADPYQLQAAIAACHDRSPSYAETDWPEIVRLYRILADVHPNPVVTVNAAIAVAEVDGPQVALAGLAEVAESARTYAWHAAAGEMYLRLDGRDQARVALHRAAAMAPSEPERRHLQRRSSDLGS